MAFTPSDDLPPNDEVGLPADRVTECDACGAPYDKAGWHRCPEGEHYGDVPWGEL